MMEEVSMSRRSKQKSRVGVTAENAVGVEAIKNGATNVVD